MRYLLRFNWQLTIIISHVLRWLPMFFNSNGISTNHGRLLPWSERSGRLSQDSWRFLVIKFENVWTHRLCSRARFKVSTVLLQTEILLHIYVVLNARESFVGCCAMRYWPEFDFFPPNSTKLGELISLTLITRPEVRIPSLALHAQLFLILFLTQMFKIRNEIIDWHSSSSSCSKLVYDKLWCTKK